MVQIEIELQGEAANNDIYELRNFLNEQLEDASWGMKPQPAVAGQMGAVEALISGSLHAGASIALDLTDSNTWDVRQLDQWPTIQEMRLVGWRNKDRHAYRRSFNISDR